MKKTTSLRLITIISLLTAAIPMSAQHLYLHYDDGKVLYLGKDNVDSITFSNYDADSVYHDEIVTQVIHTGYTKYFIPVSSIVNISCVAQDKSYSTCPDDNHPHMIDLGLPSGTKWACCNMDASCPEEYGGYYAWGETSEKSDYTKDNYFFWTDMNGNSTFDYGEYQDLGSDIAGTSYDVAYVKWGSNWRMPSVDQIIELISKCSSKWTQVNGVNGREFTGPNGGQVFMPAAGQRWNGKFTTEGSGGFYWSSTENPNPDSPSYVAYPLDFDSGSVNWYYYTFRYGGLSIRPVSK